MSGDDGREEKKAEKYCYDVCTIAFTLLGGGGDESFQPVPPASLPTC